MTLIKSGGKINKQKGSQLQLEIQTNANQKKKKKEIWNNIYNKGDGIYGRRKWEASQTKRSFSFVGEFGFQSK